MIATAVINWISTTYSMPSSVKESFNLFRASTSIDCSYNYFAKIFGENTKVQVIKTGGVYCSHEDLVNVVVARAYHNVSINNTYAIDEKPLIPHKFTNTHVRVNKDHTGKASAKRVHGFDCLKSCKPVYIICCISSNCVVGYTLLNEPCDTITYNAFLVRLVARIKKREDSLQYLLMDNASFHEILDETKDIIFSKNLAITRTPPLGCFCDPIEEFFGAVNASMTNLIKNYAQDVKERMSQQIYVELIHQAISEAAHVDFKKLYWRAGLF